ncbi:amidohydrolase [Acetomicrobium sp.]|uniref:amidohydrolase n=1 Tax=Acetomicrobium sp. TaxID=1872099 RepID=UPI0028718119|nr:amidohydrolase [Acetomicrobium sp.]MDR9770675.1 amidohydrolase [Acetomicrobium sp.]
MRTVKTVRVWVIGIVLVVVTALFVSTSLAAPVNIDAVKNDAAAFIHDHSEEFISVSDAIWSYAELGFQEFKSSEALKKLLEKYGFKVEMGVAGMPTAMVATWGSGKPIIGFTGEYDALPGLSQKAVPYKEPLVEGAPGHGCGHNLLGTTGVASAIALKHVIEKHSIPGTVKFFGCPAEESGSAKIFMVREGIFDDTDVVLDNHPGNEYEVQSGAHTSALKLYRITFIGKSAHAGSAPWDGVSALDAANIMGVAVEYLREHLYFTHRIHYIIQEGGSWPNIVPDKVVVVAYVRDTDDRLPTTCEKFENCVKAGAIASGCSYDVQVIKAYHQKHSNDTLANLIYKNMEKVGLPKWTNEEQSFAKEVQKNMGKDQTGLPDKPIFTPPPTVFTGGGSTDVGEISLVAPVATLDTPCWPKEIPGHSWGVVAVGSMSIGHKGMLLGAKVLASTAVDLLTDAEQLKKVKAEFAELSERIPYQAYVPEEIGPELDLFEDEMSKWRPLMEPHYKEPKI